MYSIIYLITTYGYYPVFFVTSSLFDWFNFNQTPNSQIVSINMNIRNVTFEKKQHFNFLMNVQCSKNTKATNSFQVWNVCFSFYRDMFHFLYFLKSSNEIFCFPVQILHLWPYFCGIEFVASEEQKVYNPPGNRMIRSLRGQFFQFEYLFTLPKMLQIDLNLFQVCNSRIFSTVSTIQLLSKFEYQTQTKYLNIQATPHDQKQINTVCHEHVNLSIQEMIFFTSND